MSILKTIEKEKVKFLMDFDYNNVLGRLKFVLGKDASFFADIRVRQNDVTWSTKDDKEYGSYIDANDSEKQIIKEVVDEQIEKLSSIISGDSLIGPHTEKIMSFPSNQYIYYTVKDGVYNVILTGWGCDTTEPKEKEDGPKQEQVSDESTSVVDSEGDKSMLEDDNKQEELSSDEQKYTPVENNSTEYVTADTSVIEGPKSSVMNFFWVNGRCGRLTFFLTWLATNVGIRVADYLSRGKTHTPEGYLYLLIILVCVWVAFCVGAKRCHDLGHNGWWQLIPFYGLWLLFAAGDPDDNEYGSAG